MKIHNDTMKEFEDFEYKQGLRMALGDGCTEKLLAFIDEHFIDRRTLVEEVEKMSINNLNINEMSKKFGVYEYQEKQEAQIIYNQALDDLLSLLKDNK
ncbi:MAG TPA: hypothetical protein ENI63_00815 [Candidatus Kaiserbacteria bacterium]|nr:hypothetical protein [Candidatus Kaiserbacteria bacterium]